MRALIAALGIYGIYRFWRSRSRHPQALLQDMRTEARGRQKRGMRARRVLYEVVEHDGGWAYKVGDVFSEAYPTVQEAADAAEQAANAHQSAGSDEMIQYQDRDGQWHEEFESGDSRPETEVDQPQPSRH